MVSPHLCSSSQFLGLRVAPSPRPSAAAAAAATTLSPRSPAVAALCSPGVPAPAPARASLYEVLGVPAGASSREIKAAYRRLALECHPDVGAPADEFMCVHAAYSTLSDPDKRADYDRQLMATAPAAAVLGRHRRPAYSRSTSFPGSCRRTWETDQCW